MGAELQIWHDQRRLWRCFVSEGERGPIDVDNVPAGTVVLDVRHPDHPWKHLGEHRVEGGATLEIGRIALEPSGRLRVRLTGAEELQASMSVTLIGATNRESGVARIAAGELTSGPLAPGRHELSISADGVRQVRREFEIEPGRDTEFTLALERCALRTVTFALPAGVPEPKWIACSLLDAQNKLVWGGNADCTHMPPRARVSAPPGTYVLWAGGEHGLKGRAELMVARETGEEPELIVNLARSP